MCIYIPWCGSVASKCHTVPGIEEIQDVTPHPRDAPDSWNVLIFLFASYTAQGPVSEYEDGRQEQQQRSEEDGSVSEQDVSPRLDSRNPAEHVRLWVLERSRSGLIDTPRTHMVRPDTTKPTTRA